MAESVLVGSGPKCDIRVDARGVEPEQLRLHWENGLIVEVLDTPTTQLNGQPLDPHQTTRLSVRTDVLRAAGALVPLKHPRVLSLYLQRGLPAHLGTIVVGADRARCHWVVDHPQVSGQHLELDPTNHRYRSVGRNGTTDDQGAAFPDNSWRSLDEGAEVFLAGVVWLPLQGLFDVPQLQTPQGSAQAGPSQTIFVSQSHEGQEIKPGDRFVLGRAENSDVRLPFVQVSARHAVVECTGPGQFQVADLGSTNGTIVRGARLRPHRPVPLAPDEKFYVGPYPMRFQRPVAPTPAEVAGAGAGTILLQASEPTQYGPNVLEVEADNVCVDVPDRRDRRQTVRLLNGVSFKAVPGDCIALMGPSGAGKTTLLSVLTGAMRTSDGQVRVNGMDLQAIYDSLRGSVGYVPQDDILHPELKVEEAVRYSAKLRLPADFSAKEIEERVEQTLRDLNLYHIRENRIGSPEQKEISGGERKRVNIALELVTDPSLILLDEPTSGLAADDTAMLVELLSSLAKRQGKTIVATIHQPAREEYELFNYVLILARGGILAYFGPTGPSSYGFFDKYRAQQNKPGPAIDNPRDMFTTMSSREKDLVAAGQPEVEARKNAAWGWNADYFNEHNPVRTEAFSGPRALGAAGRQEVPPRRKVKRAKQLSLLTSRYVLTKLRDRMGLFVLLIQAPFIALIIALVFAPGPTPKNGEEETAKQTEVVQPEWGTDLLPCLAVVADREKQLKDELKQKVADGSVSDNVRINTLGRLNAAQKDRMMSRVNDQTRALFFLIISAVWLGTSTSSREIVREQALFRRERMVNLGIANYLLSKFLPLTFLVSLQSLVLLGITYPLLQLSASFGVLLGFLVLAGMASLAVGLVLSALVRSPQAATALTPLVLIPQVLLGGAVVELTHSDALQYGSMALPTRWGFEGALYAERQAVAEAWEDKTPTAGTKEAETVRRGKKETAIVPVDKTFDCAIEQVTDATPRGGGLGFGTATRPWIAISALGATILLGLLVVAGILRLRDPT